MASFAEAAERGGQGTIVDFSGPETALSDPAREILEKARLYNGVIELHQRGVFDAVICQAADMLLEFALGSALIEVAAYQEQIN